MLLLSLFFNKPKLFYWLSGLSDQHSSDQLGQQMQDDLWKTSQT